jgi:hypothetical protein
MERWAMQPTCVDTLVCHLSDECSPKLQFTVSQNGQTPPSSQHRATPSNGTSTPAPSFDPQIQTSTNLDPSVIVSAFENNGQETPVAGETL